MTNEKAVRPACVTVHVTRWLSRYILPAVGRHNPAGIRLDHLQAGPFMLGGYPLWIEARDQCCLVSEKAPNVLVEQNESTRNS
jgi:hypothetical protein